jgi:hypothetical protein
VNTFALNNIISLPLRKLAIEGCVPAPPTDNGIFILFKPYFVNVAALFVIGEGSGLMISTGFQVEGCAAAE